MSELDVLKAQIDECEERLKEDGKILEQLLEESKQLLIRAYELKSFIENIKQKEGAYVC